MMVAAILMVMARMAMIMMTIGAVHVQAGACDVLNSPKESGNSCCNNDRSVTDALLMIVA